MFRADLPEGVARQLPGAATSCGGLPCYRFSPRQPTDTLLVIYPGALVDPAAYAPLAISLTKAGFETAIIEMPWRMATRGYDRLPASQFLDDYAYTVLIGYSQGGKMATQLVYEQPAAVDALVLLGTTHPRDYELSDSQLPILKIYGSQDAIAPPDRVEANRHLLPLGTHYTLIEGGNHSQFGYYGFQLGDGKASITHTAQRKAVSREIARFVRATH